jgi:MFS family permease
MRTAFVSIISLLLGVGILLVGNGLLGTTLSLRATTEGFSDAVTGLVMAAYFAGFVIGARVMPTLVMRLGHIRSFAVLAAIASVSSLLHGVVVAPLPWAILRAMVGVCLVGIYMVIESWLNERATNGNRGRLLGVYQSTTLIAMALGQYLILFGEINSYELFFVAAALFSFAVIPIALAQLKMPVLTSGPLLSSKQLRNLSPVALAGATGAGLVNSAFFALGAVFALRAGMPKQEIAIFMSAVMIGGALLQLPIGFASDKYDRRRVLTFVCFSGAVLGLIILMFSGRWATGAWVVAFLYGGATFVLYPLSVAHANDLVPKNQLLGVARGLLAAYGKGALIGPILAGLFMARLGPTGLFVFTAFSLMVLGLFVVSRTRRVPILPEAHRKPFVPLVRTSEAALALHPRLQQSSAKVDVNRPGYCGDPIL